MAPSVRAAFFASGLRNAGTPLEIASTPVSATAPDENARAKMNNDTPPVNGPKCSRMACVGFALAGFSTGQRAVDLPEHAVADEDRHHHHVEVRGHREDAARLLEAAEVPERQQDDEGERHLDLVGPQLGEGRGDGQRAGGDRHRHGHHVVDQERRTRHQRRGLAQVLPADDVGAATARIGVDRLPVGVGDQRQQDDDQDGDRDEVADRRGHAADADEHQHDLAGGVRRRRDRVGREDGEPDRLRYPLVVGFVGRDRSSDDDSLEAVGHVSLPRGLSGRGVPRENRRHWR